METKTVFVDFGKLHLSKAEWKLLCAIAGNPKRKYEQTAEAERLCELGLAELYETVGREPRTQSLFITSLGGSYVEYRRRGARAKAIDLLKWILPLLISVIALALAIRANSYGGTTYRANNANSAFSTATNTQQNRTNTTTNTTQNRTNTATNTQQNAGGASGEAGGNTQQSQQNRTNTATSAQQNAGSASGEAGGNTQQSQQNRTNTTTNTQQNAGGSGEPS